MKNVAKLAEAGERGRSPEIIHSARRINNVYISCLTTRYHARPEISEFKQSIGEHSHAMSAIYLSICNEAGVAPDYEIVTAIIFHDSHEHWCGDLPYDFKRLFPELATEVERKGKKIAEDQGIPAVDLDMHQLTWLKMIDLLEAYLFVRLRRPDLINRTEWQNLRGACAALAERIAENSLFFKNLPNIVLSITNEGPTLAEIINHVE